MSLCSLFFCINVDVLGVIFVQSTGLFLLDKNC